MHAINAWHKLNKTERVSGGIQKAPHQSRQKTMNGEYRHRRQRCQHAAQVNSFIHTFSWNVTFSMSPLYFRNQQFCTLLFYISSLFHFIKLHVKEIHSFDSFLGYVSVTIRRREYFFVYMQLIYCLFFVCALFFCMVSNDVVTFTLDMVAMCWYPVLD